MKDHFWATVLGDLVARRELTTDQMRAALTAMMDGSCADAEAAAFLIGLRMKGETVQELATAAQVLRDHMVAWDPECAVLDTCGTGGDSTGTFNVSTAAAFVAAGAGVKVVKHGNRSVSSKSGSADVLEALGIGVESSPDRARSQLECAGLTFCFAPCFHPALKHIAAVRRSLGVPTIFNCLGPLANPAGAQYQLLGVGRADLVDLMAGALARLGTSRALVVCGRDGLDEVSLSGATTVRDVQGHEVRSLEWLPADFGLDELCLSEVTVANAGESAALIERVLDGHEGAAARLVLANAAAALVAAEAVSTPAQGVAVASDVILSGRGRKVLDQLRALSPS